MMEEMQSEMRVPIEGPEPGKFGISVLAEIRRFAQEGLALPAIGRRFLTVERLETARVGIIEEVQVRFSLARTAQPVPVPSRDDPMSSSEWPPKNAPSVRRPSYNFTFRGDRPLWMNVKELTALIDSSGMGTFQSPPTKQDATVGVSANGGSLTGLRTTGIAYLRRMPLIRALLK
jgi:hypothetical protein